MTHVRLTRAEVARILAYTQTEPRPTFPAEMVANLAHTALVGLLDADQATRHHLLGDDLALPPLDQGDRLRAHRSSR
jgi:hypothetical protein